MMQFNLVFEQLSTDATDGCMTKRFKLSVNDRKKTLHICHRFLVLEFNFFKDDKIARTPAFRAGPGFSVFAGGSLGSPSSI